MDRSQCKNKLESKILFHHREILDTPCTAGARSTISIRACRLRLGVQNDEPPADDLRQITQDRGKLSKDSISGRIWRVHAFVIFLQKSTKSGSEKRSLNRLIPALNFINERSTFGSFKIKRPNYQ